MLQFLRGVAGVCFTLAIASANAATVTYSFANPLSTTEINQAMPLSLFDSNLGTLTGASLTVTGNMIAYMTVTNRATVTRTSTLTLMSDIGIRSSLVGVNQLFDNFSDIPLSNTIGPSCCIPDDCIDSKRYPLFMARAVLQELIESLQSSQEVKPC